MRKLSRGTSIIAGGVVATTLVGVAYAAWTSSGSGSGSATSFETVESDITVVTPVADLYPGATGSMQVKIKNNNPYPATVTSISAGSSTAENGCAAGTVTSDADSAPAGSELAAGAEGTYTLVTHMAATATNACRNVEFDLPLTAVLTTGS